jgi:hypothetical protein
VDAAGWVRQELRRHDVDLPANPAADGYGFSLSGDWRGCWNARRVFGTLKPFVQEMVIDTAGALTGAGRDLLAGGHGEPFHIRGGVWRDGEVTRIHWIKSYDRLVDVVDYEGVLVGHAVAGHFVHRQMPILRGTFAVARDGTVPAVARRSPGANLIGAL